MVGWSGSQPVSMDTDDIGDGNRVTASDLTHLGRNYIPDRLPSKPSPGGCVRQSRWSMTMGHHQRRKRACLILNILNEMPDRPARTGAMRYLFIKLARTPYSPRGSVKDPRRYHPDRTGRLDCMGRAIFNFEVNASIMIHHPG